MRFWRSPVGWAFATVYVAAFAWAYVDYWRNRGTWMADLGLDILALPYILVGRVVTMSATFELHGFQPWGLVPAVLFCAFLAYLLGAVLQRAVVTVRRRVAARAERGDSG
jgi:hypothetical protein